MQRGIAWIVDDDSSIRWVLERALTGAGLSCTTFESGNEVLDALTTKPRMYCCQISVCPEWMVWRCSNRLSSAIQCFRSS